MAIFRRLTLLRSQHDLKKATTSQTSLNQSTLKNISNIKNAYLDNVYCYTYIFTYMSYTYVYIYIYVYVFTYMSYIYIYSYIYMYLHIHIHILEKKKEKKTVLPGLSLNPSKCSSKVLVHLRIIWFQIHRFLLQAHIGGLSKVATPGNPGIWMDGWTLILR